MAVLLRPATVADAAVINDIYNPYVATSTCTFQLEPSTLEERTAWLTSLSPKHPVLIASIDDEVVGWGALVPFHTRAGYARSVENSVYVRQSAHGKGVGSALLQALIVLAREHGFHTIVARIASDQEASLRLHERFGFDETGRLMEIGWKFDRYLDVVILQLMLNA